MIEIDTPEPEAGEVLIHLYGTPSFLVSKDSLTGHQDSFWRLSFGLWNYCMHHKAFARENTKRAGVYKCDMTIRNFDVNARNRLADMKALVLSSNWDQM